MIKEVYGHINLATRQRAIEQRDDFMEALGVGTKVAQLRSRKKPRFSKV